jgi:hypothetical protein
MGKPDSSPSEVVSETELPDGWRAVQLGGLLREDLRNGHSARESSNGEGVRTLTLTSVTRRDFSLQNTKVTVADPDKVRDLWLRPGDVFVERANTICSSAFGSARKRPIRTSSPINS